MAAAQQSLLGVGAAGGGGGIAFVASVLSQGATSGTTSSAIDTTGANFLAVWVVWFVSPTVSDSKGNTYTALATSTRTNTTGQWYYCLAPSVGTGHTFSATGTNTYSALVATAFSGVKTASAFDVQNGAGAVAATSISTGSVTPAENGELILAGSGHGSFDVPNTGTGSVDSGMTLMHRAPNIFGQSFGCMAAYLIQTTSAAISPAFSWAGSDGGAVARIATFKKQ